MTGPRRATPISRGRRWARRFAAAYLLLLVVVILAFRFIGERHWAVTLGLYLPRIGFLLPLPFLAMGLLIAGDRLRAVLATSVATFLVVVPLMGFELPGEDEAAGNTIRLMTWNTFFGRIDSDGIRRIVDDENPDIFLAQATAHRTKELFRDNPGRYIVEIDDEFLIATRFPIVAKLVGAPIAEDSRHRSNFVRYTLQTEAGPIDVFNIHPYSPRQGLDSVRGIGLRSALLGGDSIVDAMRTVQVNSTVRRRQVEAVVAAMRSSRNPILVAGDTNLPGSSWLYANAFGHLHDAFVEAGSGFGYTFPSKLPWMRIDRILGDESFRFVRYRTGERIASDHLYVVAEAARGTAH